MLKFILSFLLLGLILTTQQADAQKFFKLIDQADHLPSKNGFRTMKHYQPFYLDKAQLSKYLSTQTAKDDYSKAIPLTFPMPDGTWETYQVVESPVMEEALAAKFPEIKTYKGFQGASTMRLSISPYSFQAIFLTTSGEIVIENLSEGNQQYFGVFRASDLEVRSGSQDLACGTHDLEAIVHTGESSEFKQNILKVRGVEPMNLRKFRLALSCTGEWGSAASLGGGTTQSALDKMVASVNILNSIYEKDFGAHLDLIANNEFLINLDALLDPYSSPRSGRDIISENTQIVNQKVGSRSYDVGHCFTVGCTDVGGVANLASLCSTTGGKANGCTCWYTTDINYVTQRIFCHEMGHQFSATHTFSNCNGNEEGRTAYEPGSGTTIMSYSGLCGGLNVEMGSTPHPDFFHVASVEQALTMTRLVVSSCGTTLTTNNTKPTVNIEVPEGLTIPIQTPISLTGSATDAEGDVLTYSWEQFNPGAYGDAIGSVSLTSVGPLFKVNFPSTDPVRVIPNWSSILGAQNFNLREVLPSVSRPLDFRFVVRDNNAESGAVSWENLHLEVTDQAGPFTVMKPNGSGDVLYKNACNVIKWDAANTNVAPVSCSKVNIYLIYKNNVKNPILLKENADNDGEEIVDIPDSMAVANCRIMVKSVGNVFFDVSDQDISLIESNSPSYDFNVNPQVAKICLPARLDLHLQSCFRNSNSSSIQLIVGQGLPTGATYRFSKTELGPNDNAELSIDLNSVNVLSNLVFQVGAVRPGGDTVYSDVKVKVINNNFSDMALLLPFNGSTGIIEAPLFQWLSSINSITNDFELATSPEFGNTIIFSKNNLTVNKLQLPITLEPSKVYYWRLRPNNECGSNSTSEVYTFQTVNKNCSVKSYPDNPVNVGSGVSTKRIPIVIEEEGIISDLNLKKVIIDADAVTDVKLNLVSPNGTVINLLNYNCGISTEINCQFDDAAPNGIYCPPTNNVAMRPNTKLALLNGENVKGEWNLEQQTKTSYRGGVMVEYSIEYCADIIVKNPFVVNNIALRLDNLQSREIPSSLLEVKDDDNVAAELKFTLMSIPTYGDLKLKGNLLTYGSTFTQADIDSGNLSYSHTAVPNVTDGFIFNVQDGAGGFYGVDLFKIIVGTVSSKDLADELHFGLFPNPTDGEIHLIFPQSLSEKDRIQIFRLDGVEIKTFQCEKSSTQTLDLSDLTDGIYIVNVQVNGKKAQKKLIISGN